jgi:hypothetical protein
MGTSSNNLTRAIARQEGDIAPLKNCRYYDDAQPIATKKLSLHRKPCKYLTSHKAIGRYGYYALLSLLPFELSHGLVVHIRYSTLQLVPTIFYAVLVHGSGRLKQRQIISPYVSSLY